MVLANLTTENLFSKTTLFVLLKNKLSTNVLLAFVSLGDWLTDSCGGDFSFVIIGLAELWYVVLSELSRSKDLGCSWTVLLS